MPLTVKLEWESKVTYDQVITFKDDELKEMKAAGADIADPEVLFCYLRDAEGLTDFDGVWGPDVFVAGEIRP